MKAPHYFGSEPAIRNTFHDASFIMTHRHPVETIASLCSFLEAMNRLASDEQGDPSLYVNGGAYQIKQHIDIRRMRKDIAFLDIHYRELTRSIATVAEKVYAFNRITLTDASRKRMTNWDKDHPMHAKGAHGYSLADFGFTEEQINREFSPYIDLMGELFSTNR